MAIAILWVFTVRPDQAEAFEAAYGPRGSWAALFGQSPGFLGTELWRDAAIGRYHTVDRWVSRSACEAFHAAKGEDYAALDRACEALTETEACLGTFDLLD